MKITKIRMEVPEDFLKGFAAIVNEKEEYLCLKVEGYPYVLLFSSPKALKVYFRDIGMEPAVYTAELIIDQKAFLDSADGLSFMLDPERQEDGRVTGFILIQRNDKRFASELTQEG